MNLNFVLAGMAVFVGAASIPYIRDYSPHSVDDPAMLMLVLSVITFSAASTWPSASRSAIKLPDPRHLFSATLDIRMTCRQ